MRQSKKGKREPNLGKLQSVPMAMSRPTTASGPEEKMSADRMTRRVVHRELIGSVKGSEAFTVESHEINPGLAPVFPWLATQAGGWEYYHFRRLVFEYIPRCAVTSTGSVYLIPEYDPLDAAPTTEAEAAVAAGARSDAPWRAQSLVLSPAAMFPLGPRKYVRSTVVDAERRTADVGLLHVCTVGQANATDVGQLWVSYDVELFIPQIAVPHTSTRTTAFVSGVEAAVNGIKVVLPLASEVPSINGLNIPLSPMDHSFILKPGAYNLTAEANFTDFANELGSAALYLRNMTTGIDTSIALEAFPARVGGFSSSMDALRTIVVNALSTFKLVGLINGTTGNLQFDSSHLRITPA